MIAPRPEGNGDQAKDKRQIGEKQGQHVPSFPAGGAGAAV
jgi:hypothetical protein